MSESRRVYTGIHLLLYSNRTRQFGSVDAWADQPELAPIVRLFFGKQLENRLQASEEGVAIEMTLDEAGILLENLNTVSERIKYLVLLAKKGKLTNDAYYPITPLRKES